MDRSARFVRSLTLPLRVGPKLTMLVVDFFNHVNMLYGTISEFCTPTEVSSKLLMESGTRADMFSAPS